MMETGLTLVTNAARHNTPMANVARLNRSSYRLLCRFHLRGCSASAADSTSLTRRVAMTLLTRRSRSACECSMLHLQIHQFGRRHHVVVQICHDQKRSDNDQDDDQHTKRQCHHVIGVVRTRGDMQEKH